ncbi:MAG: phosphotransferase [Pirellulales bacterium]|nr:phosphotransferase [Pirellulales bacterium]
MKLPDPSPVLDAYSPLARGARVEFLGQAGGLSGAVFWRVRTPVAVLCLRRWPREHPTRRRLDWIHAVLTHAAGRGIDFLPVPLATSRGETIVERDGHLWELAPWLPGRSDFAAQPTVERLEAALAALARFHIAVADFPTNAPRIGPAPGIAARLEQASKLAAEELDQLSAAIADHDWPELVERARGIVAALKAPLPRVRPTLQQVRERSVPLAPCLRDIWHENVLFEGEHVTGIVDFGAMRVDSVATDVARLLGSMAVDDLPKWRAGLAAYQQVRPLSHDESELVAAYDASGVLLAGVHWLRWLYVEGQTFDDRPRVLARLDHFLGRLTRLAQVDAAPVAALAVQSLQRPVVS